MVPWRLKQLAETGPGAGSKAKDIEGGGEGKKKKGYELLVYKYVRSDVSGAQGTYSSGGFGHPYPRS